MKPRNVKQLENRNAAYIYKTLKNKTPIKRMKKQKISKLTVKQKGVAKTKCDRLYIISYGKSIIVDDKSYFTLSHSTINVNGNFYLSDV